MSLKRGDKENPQPKLVWWPVTLYEPKDGGDSINHKVKVQYEILEEKEKDETIADGGDLGFLRRVVHDWSGFQESDGSEIACDDESRSYFFNTSWVKNGLVNGYFVAAVGGRRKNL